MKRRLLALLLVLVLLTSMLPVQIFASPPEQTAAYQAAYAGEISIDGTLSEKQWNTYGKMTNGTDTRAFDILWDNENLYIAVEPDAADTSFAAEIAGQTLTVDKTAGASGITGASSIWGEAVEVKVPLRTAVKDYGQTVAVKLSAGDIVWAGEAALTSTQRQTAYDFTESVWSGKKLNNNASNNVQTRTGDGGINWSRKYTTEVPLDKSDYDVYFFSTSTKDAVLSTGLTNTTIEFDYCADAMPSYSQVYQSAGYILQGLSISFVSQGNGGQCLLINLSCSNGNVFLNWGDGSAKTMKVISKDTGKDLGDKFHVSLFINSENTLEVYIDGVLLETIENAVVSSYPLGSINQPAIIRMTNYCKPAEDGQAADGSKDIDFTIWNLTFGKNKGNSIIDDLTWNDIKGANASPNSVINDLALPTTLDNAHIPGCSLSWASSDEDAVSSAGVVGNVGENTNVTLTATVVGSNPVITKDFYITVPALTMDATLTQDTITLDGQKSEKIWASAGSKAFSIFSGVAAKVDALWSTNTLYLAVEYGAATTMDLTLGEHAWTGVALNGTIEETGLTGYAGAGIAELKIDLGKAGVVLGDYNETRSFQIKLAGEGVSAQIEQDPILLVFSSRYLETGGVTTVVDPASANLQSGSSFSGGVRTLTTTGGLSYWIRLGQSVIDSDKDVRMDMQLKITSLPAFAGDANGKVNSDLDANGFFFWLTHNTAASGTRGPGSGAVIYNTGIDDKLAIKGMYNGEILELGVQVGEAFALGYAWNADDSVEIFVNGTSIGSLGTNTKTIAGAGDNALQVRTRALAGTTVTAEISAVTLSNYYSREAYFSLEDELSKANVLEGIGLTDLTAEDTITLPGSFETMLGTCALGWASNSDLLTLVENPDGSYTGTVTQPNTRVNGYAALTMTQNGKEYWSIEASILGLRVSEIDEVTHLRVPYTAAGITIDGTTTDEGWSLDIRVLNDKNLIVGTFGAQWTSDNLYLAVKDATVEMLDPESLTVTVNGKSVPVTAAGIAGNVAEMAISMEDLGIELTDYGIEIPAKVVLGENSWEGTLVITSNDWFGTDGTDPRLLASSGSQGTVKNGGGDPTKNQGIEDLGNGWRLYDLYDPMGNNPNLVRSYQLYWAQGSTNQTAIDLYANLDDREHPIYTEFDFLAKAMPQYTPSEANANSPYFSNYGLTWNVAHRQFANDDKRSYSVSMGIYNTEEGLVFCVMGSTITTVVLNKYVGDQFRLGTSWNPDGSLILYIDGEEYARFEKAETLKSAYGSASFIVNLIRNKQAATSSAESFDLYITNISLGKSRGESIVDQLTESLILGENEDIYSVTQNLNMPAELHDDQLNRTADIQWTSSDPSVIAANGTVTQPAKGGRQVTLTATYNDTQRSFTVYVKGLTYESDIMVVENDLDTANGAGYLKDTYFFTLDTTNNSVVLDQKESKRFNVITLTDNDDCNRLNESNLTIWASDDNITYTRVDSFKILRHGNKVYLYDFEAEGRYVKVHCTEFRPNEADFIAPLEQMIKASFEEVFGDNGEAFENSTTVTVSNAANEKKWDEHYVISAADIETTKTDKSDVRFFLNGELLYHYYDGESFVVRIPEIEAESSVALTVLSGNEAAMSIDNKEYTLEVVFGTREVRIYDDAGRWPCELPNGTLVSVQCDNSEIEGEDYLTVAYSYDGGLIWTDPVEIVGTRDWLHNPGGLTYIPQTGRLILEGYHYKQFVPSDMNASDCKLRFMYSDDLGATWTRCDDIAYLGERSNYFLSYSDPVIVSSFDGEGPNVDLVLNSAAQAGNDGSFCCRVVYSCDGGLTWTVGADKINYTLGEGLHAIEGGISEGTILESQVTPGKLVLFARCQFESVDVFATSYSLDYGKTWETEATLSSIYTPNTQPILHEFGGAQLLFWGGNNVLGGNSYQRMPMNVGISRDDLVTFEGIQDLYARLSLQGMTSTTRNQIINQAVANRGDTLYVVWDNNFVESLMMRVDNFTDWFYRTKNAYDSFETASAKAEGWSTTAGSVERSNLHALDGNYSLRMTGGSSIVRSVPYLQNGTVSLNLYMNKGSAVNIQLQSAYSDVYGEAAPIAFELKNGKLYFLGGEIGINVGIIEGWNNFTFKLDLDAAVPAAELYLNGEKVADAPIDLEVGDYVCWLNIDAPDGVLYLDDVFIHDTDTVEVPAAPEEPGNGLKISGATLTLYDNITVNYWVKKSLFDGTGYENPYMEFEFEGKKTRVSEYTEKGDYYCFAFSDIAPDKMNDTIKSTLYASVDGKVICGKTKEYSIATYCYEMLKTCTNEDAELRTLLVDLLNYGAATQMYTDHNVDSLVNANLTVEQKAWGTQSNPSLSDALNTKFAEIASPSVHWKGAQLILNNAITMKFKIQADSIENLIVKVTDDNGHNWSIDANTFIKDQDDLYYVYFSELDASQMSDSVYLTVCNGDTAVSNTVRYSIESYAYAKENCGDENLENLVISMMKYGNSAKAYNDSKKGAN